MRKIFFLTLFLLFIQAACAGRPAVPASLPETVAATSTPQAVPSPPSIATAVFAPTPTAMENVFYVATSGNDDVGDGSIEAPWATITQAVETVPDGSSILVPPGP